MNDYFVCKPFDLHPYCCGDGCFHCSKTKTADHDPEQCALCHYLDESRDLDRNEP